MSHLQRAGAVAALLEAAIYIAVFVFYGAVFGYPAQATAGQKLAVLAQYQAALSMVNLVGYVVFGVLLAVIVLALHERFKTQNAWLVQLGSIFGLVWVGLVIASGMIANIGLGEVVKLSSETPDEAWRLWRTIGTVVEGIGGGNEVVGGLWVLLVSLAALRAGVMPRALHWLGLTVGVAGVLTVYPAQVLTEVFGVGQIVWFVWLGSSMMRIPDAELRPLSTAMEDRQFF